MLLVFCLTIFITSCDTRPSNVLSKRKMEKLLVDMHLLDAAVQTSGSVGGGEEQNKRYYDALFDKYGITKVDFDSCLAWYTKHPKKFERVYLNVQEDLKKIEADVKEYKYHPYDTIRKQDIWYANRKYLLTKDTARTKINFAVENTELMPLDRYELTFLHRIAPVDSSKNPHAVMYVNYMDGSADSIYTKTRNDSVLRRYTLKFKARKITRVKSITGQLLGYDAQKGKVNAYVDSIKLIRKYNPQIQDKLRDELNKQDSIAKLPVKEEKKLDKKKKMPRPDELISK